MAVLQRNTDDLRSRLKMAIGRDTVDVVGDGLWPYLIDTIARGGRYTCTGAIAGPVVDFALRTFYLRDLIFTGATGASPAVLKA